MGKEETARQPVRYQDVVGEVARRTGLDFDQARTAAETTVAVLAQALDRVGRDRLFGEVPAEWLARSREWAPPEAPGLLGPVGDRDRDLVEALSAVGDGPVPTARAPRPAPTARAPRRTRPIRRRAR